MWSHASVFVSDTHLQEMYFFSDKAVYSLYISIQPLLFIDETVLWHD